MIDSDLKRRHMLPNASTWNAPVYALKVPALTRLSAMTMSAQAPDTLQIARDRPEGWAAAR